MSHRPSPPPAPERAEDRLSSLRHSTELTHTTSVMLRVPSLLLLLGSSDSGTFHFEMLEGKTTFMLSVLQQFSHLYPGCVPTQITILTSSHLGATRLVAQSRKVLAATVGEENVSQSLHVFAGGHLPTSWDYVRDCERKDDGSLEVSVVLLDDCITFLRQAKHVALFEELCLSCLQCSHRFTAVYHHKHLVCLVSLQSARSVNATKLLLENISGFVLMRSALSLSSATELQCDRKSVCGVKGRLAISVPTSLLSSSRKIFVSL